MSNNGNNQERTFIMVKPDGVQRGLVGEIITRFERRGYQLLAAKLTVPTRELLDKHYAEHVSKGFYPGLAKFMSSGPVFATVWQGKDVVKTGRRMLGETHPLNSQPGTIRGDFGIDLGRNICHGSDGVEAAEREIALWFPEGVQSYNKIINAQIYE
jgi:nucleoside-diphosphate kinase